MGSARLTRRVTSSKLGFADFGFTEVTAGVLPACEELGIGFVPFSPLGKAAGRLKPA